MVNNQKEFNNKYPKEAKEIKFKNGEFEERQLLVENYSKLEKLYLRDDGNIDKITLKNLTQLQECTVWNCGVQDLVIENCPQLKKLNVKSNSLTNLEFLANLKNLEELELDNNIEIEFGLEYLPNDLKKFSCENTKLVETLRPYQDNWKVYQKDLQELVQLANQKPQELLKNIQGLKKEINKLKDKQLVTIDKPDDFKKKYQELKGALNFLIKEEELKSKEIDKLVTDDILEGIKDLKEDLSKVQKTKNELEKQLAHFENLYLVKKQKIEQKEKELEGLKITCLEKSNHYERTKEKMNELLKIQSEIALNDREYFHERKSEIKDKLTRKTKLTIEELDKICQLQTEITQLKLEIQKNFNKVNQIFHVNSIGNYAVKPNLKHLIGKGGYGEVYYGKWKSQEVAVKQLYLSLNNVSEFDLKDVQREISILKNLRNKYIIQYYDIYYGGQELLIIMDYAENGTLTKFINRNKDKEHDWNFNGELIKQMALGLTYIHHEKIIHRDLKSMNILLTKNNDVKISDFGLAKTKDISSSQSRDMKGTLRWMAPETLKEKKYSEQSDIYSLGMIIWEISAKCTRPFKDIDDNLVALHIIGGGREVVLSDIPKNIQNIIQQCWKENPDKRIALENILEKIESDELSSQMAYTSHTSEFENPPGSQSKQFKNSQQKNISKSVKFPASELQKVLEKTSKQEELYTNEMIEIWHSEETDINKEEVENPEFILQVEQSPK